MPRILVRTSFGPDLVALFAVAATLVVVGVLQANVARADEAAIVRRSKASVSDLRQRGAPLEPGGLRTSTRRSAR
jgi:hypothetical protein